MKEETCEWQIEERKAKLVSDSWTEDDYVCKQADMLTRARTHTHTWL